MPVILSYIYTIQMHIQSTLWGRQCDSNITISDESRLWLMRRRWSMSLSPWWLLSLSTVVCIFEQCWVRISPKHYAYSVCTVVPCTYMRIQSAAGVHSNNEGNDYSLCFVRLHRCTRQTLVRVLGNWSTSIRIRTETLYVLFEYVRIRILRWFLS